MLYIHKVTHVLRRMQSGPIPGLCVATCEVTNKAWTNRRWKQGEGKERETEKEEGVRVVCTCIVTPAR